jgi:Spy/CpxP family protein refolding chaperone
MNKTITALAIGIMTAASTAVLAQPPGWGYGPGYGQAPATAAQPGPGYGRGPGWSGRGDPAQRIAGRVDYLTDQLNLSADQKTKITSILEEQRAKRTGMRGETHDRIAAVLNDEQRAKFDQMKGAGRGPGMGRGMGKGPGPGYGPGMGYGPGPGYGRGMGYGPGYGGCRGPCGQ